MKKILVILLCVLFAVSAFVSCANSTPADTKSNSSEQTQGSDTEPEETQDPNYIMDPDVIENGAQFKGKTLTILANDDFWPADDLFVEEDSDDVLIAIEQIIRTLLDFLLSPDMMRMIGNAGGRIIRALLPAAKELAADLLGFAYDLFTEYGEALLTPDWGEIGKNIVYGILDGLLGVDFDAELFKSDFAENWLSGIKDIFGIHSPSRLMRDQIGKNLALGIEVGFDESIPDTLEIPSRFELTRPQIDPAALDALRTAPLPDASAIVPQSATSIVNNSYYSTSNTTTTNNTATTEQQQKTPAPSGDVIIPVYIGGENIETLVVTAAQIANARSGGATI